MQRSTWQIWYPFKPPFNESFKTYKSLADEAYHQKGTSTLQECLDSANQLLKIMRQYSRIDYKDLGLSLR